MLKKEGMIQCAGEALFSDDIPPIADEVFASFVLSTVANAEIESIDGSKALVSKMPVRCIYYYTLNYPYLPLVLQFVYTDLHVCFRK